MKSIHYALHNVHSRGYVAEHERSLIIYVMQISSKIIIVTVRQTATEAISVHKRKLGNISTISNCVKAVAQCRIST